MKISEFFAGAFKGAQDAGIQIEADDPTTTVAAPATAEQPDPALVAVQAEAAELRQQIATLNAAAAKQRAEALVSGWVGAKDDHLAILSALGEGTPAYDAYARQQAAHAAQIAASGLFSERGSDRGGEASAWAQIQARAAALVAATPGMTQAQAIAQVAQSDPKLYAAYQAEK